MPYSPPDSRQRVTQAGQIGHLETPVLGEQGPVRRRQALAHLGDDGDLLRSGLAGSCSGWFLYRRPYGPSSSGGVARERPGRVSPRLVGRVLPDCSGPNRLRA